MSRPPRPIYFRVLRVRHLRLGPVVMFLLFEGSIALALLLCLADLVNVWGLLAIPIAVAIMVKLNDAVAAALIRPLALAQLRTPRLGDESAVGRSRVPRPSYPTTFIDSDDAVLSAEARPEPLPEPLTDPLTEPLAGPSTEAWPGSLPVVARGVAPVPEQNLFNGRRRPAPGVPTTDSDLEQGGDLEPVEHHENPVRWTVDGQRRDGADRRSRGNQGRFID